MTNQPTTPWPDNFVESPYPDLEMPLPLRVVLAHIWAETLLGHVGDNGDASTMTRMACFGVRDQKMDAVERILIARALRDLSTRDLDCVRGPFQRRDATELGVDYDPCEFLQAVVEVASPGKKPYAGFYPWKTRTRVHPASFASRESSDHTGHVMAKFGYAAPELYFHPMADGRVFVSRWALPGDLLEYLAARLAAGETVPGLTHAGFNWVSYNNVLGPCVWACA